MNYMKLTQIPSFCVRDSSHWNVRQGGSVVEDVSVIIAEHHRIRELEALSKAGAPHVNSQIALLPG